MRRLALLVVLLGSLPGVARAGDGDSALSLGVGGGTFTLPGPEQDQTLSPTAGGVVTAVYEHGFSEAWSWRAEAAGGLYGGGGLSWSGVAAAGLVYRFDVLKYVPYAVLELGASAVGGGPVPSATIDPVAALGVGLDVLQSRTRSWGVEGRVSTLAGVLGGDTTLYSLGVRYTWRWGFF